MAKIKVNETEITVIANNQNDYISLTDIARYKSDDPTAVIASWMRNRNTIEYLGLWESLYNPNFKPTEFEVFRKQAGLNAFTLSPQRWIETTGAIGIISKSGRYGGTYAHKDIAFRFASWISVEFELYIAKGMRKETFVTMQQSTSSSACQIWRISTPCSLATECLKTSV